ncbi:hypothetical protein B0F88_10882 [Methylobacter tundripaludum]|uniref:Uncharacterized protein n=1 Tax=Methylobacter tundripaludum TaxID=173365 RepID=A0A2S6GZZ0_9GAMM|nr:hypothetical protein B0F88_10882 [Methylobacter tundripaludum]
MESRCKVAGNHFPETIKDGFTAILYLERLVVSRVELFDFFIPV